MSDGTVSFNRLKINYILLFSIPRTFCSLQHCSFLEDDDERVWLTLAQPGLPYGHGRSGRNSDYTAVKIPRQLQDTACFSATTIETWCAVAVTSRKTINYSNTPLYALFLPLGYMTPVIDNSQQ